MGAKDLAINSPLFDSFANVAKVFTCIINSETST